MTDSENKHSNSENGWVCSLILFMTLRLNNRLRSLFMLFFARFRLVSSIQMGFIFKFVSSGCKQYNYSLFNGKIKLIGGDSF